MFKKENESWYKKVYDSIIERGKLRGNNKEILNYYTEAHHIIPVCRGGTETVLLTYKEHVICHYILYRLNLDDFSILQSVIAVISRGNTFQERDTYRPSKETLKYFTKKLSEGRKGKKHSEITKKKISESNKGRKMSETLKEKLKKLSTGRKASDETKKRMSESHKNISEEIRRNISNSQKGRKHSEETKQKISESNKGRIFSEEHKRNISNGKIGKPGHKHTLNDLKKMSDNSPCKKKVQGPNGNIYNSMKECSKSLGICRDTLRKWINDPTKGYKFI